MVRLLDKLLISALHFSLIYWTIDNVHHSLAMVRVLAVGLS